MPARSPFILSLIWMGFFLAALCIVESYIHATTPEGKRYLLPEDRTDCLRPVLTLYALYLSAILAFWFVKPFREPKSEQADKARFILAVVCTVIFNGYILFLLSNAYFSAAGQRDVISDVIASTTVSKWLSFIVAPVNAFYFGARRRESGS